MTALLRNILEDCERGFAEVAILYRNSVLAADIFTVLEGLEFNDNLATFKMEDGSQMRFNLDAVSEARFVYKERNELGLPSYSLWLMDENGNPALTIYLRKSENEETNPMRHDHFLRIQQKYGKIVNLKGQASKASKPA